MFFYSVVFIYAYIARRCHLVEICDIASSCRDAKIIDGAQVSNFNSKSCNLIQKCLFHCENISVTRTHTHNFLFFFLQTTKLHNIMQKTREGKRLREVREAQRGFAVIKREHSVQSKESNGCSFFFLIPRQSSDICLWSDDHPGALVLSQ